MTPRPPCEFATTYGDESVSSEEFRRLIGMFATGVTVVTTVDRGVPYGTTVSALTSVSLEPPTLLICMNRSSETGQAITRSRHFAINVLSEDQGPVASDFARKGSDFVGHATTPGRRGAPLVAGSLATFECRVTDEIEVRTHTVVIGTVEAATGQGGSPLAYFRGRFGQLLPDPRLSEPEAR
ncbi:flavin reductase family protein [Streptomyces sp. NPDC001982]|uniref:flavin reductase family protein n=1 Tax=Streptomyces sp. NPDC001982 TaxID=3154405 RepID=UPI00331FA7BD